MTTEFKTKSPNPQFPQVMDVHPEELAKLTSSARIIDVRQPDEFTGELGHIPEAELWVLDHLPEKINSLPHDQTIVFVCRSGARSAKAAAFALENGFTDVYNMAGGMILWNHLGLPKS